MKQSSMRRLLLFAFLVFAQPIFAGELFQVVDSNRTILHSGQWTPTPGQTQRAFARIQAFLQKNQPNQRAVGEILADKAGYRVQFLGIQRAGKQIMVCNFFPAHHAASRDPFSFWKERQVIVRDGGAQFWQIEYELTTDRCSGFQVHFEA
jgi:hypothetical protein